MMTHFSLKNTIESSLMFIHIYAIEIILLNRIEYIHSSIIESVIV